MSDQSLQTPAEEREPALFLEPDQFVADKSRPLPRLRLGGRASAGLWALRVFVLVVGAMVIYTFVSQLAS